MFLMSTILCYNFFVYLYLKSDRKLNFTILKLLDLQLEYNYEKGFV